MKLSALQLLLIAVMASVTAHAGPETALEVMTRVDNRDDGDHSEALLEMVLIDKRGHQRVRRMKRFSRDVGKDIENLIFFLHPNDVRNTGYLSYDFKPGMKDDDQWLYLPALKKVKRIASSDKSDSFMGSDFSYSDITQRDLDDYRFSILKEINMEGKDLWVIEALPKEQRVIEQTGYTKNILFVRKDIDMVVRAIYYVREGKKTKYYDVKKLEQIDGIWTATEKHMTTKLGKKTLHKTVLKQRQTKFNQQFEDALFNIRTLQRGV